MTCKACGKQIYPIFKISFLCAECFLKTKKPGIKKIFYKTTFKSNEDKLLYKGGIIK